MRSRGSDRGRRGAALARPDAPGTSGHPQARAGPADVAEMTAELRHRVQITIAVSPATGCEASCRRSCSRRRAFIGMALVIGNSWWDGWLQHPNHSQQKLPVANPADLPRQRDSFNRFAIVTDLAAITQIFANSATCGASARSEKVRPTVRVSAGFRLQQLKAPDMIACAPKSAQPRTGAARFRSVNPSRGHSFRS